MKAQYCKKYPNDKVLPDEQGNCSLCGGDCTTRNTQHTPAPWKTNGTQIFKFDESKGEEFQDREIIANIYLAHQDNKEQREATAQLIASAPELLKENEQLKDLNRVHYEVTADQNLKIQDLKDLNAGLLEALKSARYELMTCKENASKIEIQEIDLTLNKVNSAIAKAEGKTIN